jgi:hypothetical protein
MAALLVACGGGVSAADGKLIPVTTVAGSGGLVTTSTTSTTSTTTSTSTTTEPVSTTATTTLPVIPGVDPALEQTVWTAYLAAWATVDEVSLDPDPNAPGLLQHLTNAQLRFWQGDLSEMAKEGEIARYPYRSKHAWYLYGVTVKSPNWVDLDVCSLDDAVVSVKATGTVVNDDVIYLRSTETMWLVNGIWMLAGRNGKKVGEAQCKES